MREHSNNPKVKGRTDCHSHKRRVRKCSALPLEMTGFLEFERPGFFVASGQFSPEFSPVTPRSHRVSWIPGEILSTLLILDAEVLFAAVSR